MATYVPIHGAADVVSNWELVTAGLRKRGHDVVEVDLPCEEESAGFGDYADAVVEAVGNRDSVILAAHSLGGFTAPLVCERRPVDLIVLVSAMVPRPGEPAGDWWANTGHGQALEEVGGDHEGDLEVFLHDVPADRAAESLARGRDQAEAPLLEPWPLAEWPDVPTRYLLCRDDRWHPAGWTRQMVEERLGIEPDEIDGGHCPYLSRPQELAERLDAYGRSIRRPKES